MNSKLDDLHIKPILIVGLARNCGDQLNQSISRLTQSFSSFKFLNWLVVESDSSDNTVDELLQLQKDIENFRYLSLGELRVKLPLRTERIAHCRNRYIKELNHNPIYEKIEYVIVADLDGVNNLLTESAVLSCWNRTFWDVCTANQRGPYYDVYALRHSAWAANDCWDQYHFLRSCGVSPEKALYNSTHSRMIKIPENMDWIEVDSAFGGFAIYRKEAMKFASYVGINSNGGEVCEHVAMHRQLRAHGFRIFINPNLINSGITEHTAHLFFFQRIKRGINDFVKKILVLLFSDVWVSKIKQFVQKNY